MEYVFTGFRQVDTMRHYSFQGIADDHTRTSYVVATDVTLLRKYSIALQDVALLCRRFLQQRDATDVRHSVILTEEEMRRIAEARTALLELAASKRKPHRVPASRKVGQAWRSETAR
jgi:hypothetical protein